MAFVDSVADGSNGHQIARDDKAVERWALM